MRIPVVAGRTFTPDDRAGGHRVCLVNESLAARLFGDRPAVGQVILRGREAEQPFEIVGVVADVKTNGLRSDTPDEIFYPFRQNPRATAAIVARTTADPAALATVLASTVADLDPEEPISRFATMEGRLSATLDVERAMAGLATALAVLAIVLAAIGLYAVVAHSVATRHVEFGIRLALGASPRTVASLIVRHSLRLVLVGTGIGLGAAAGASGLLTAQLYDVTAHDWRAYAVVAGLFVMVGLIASIAPALRAARVEPRTALGGNLRGGLT
jgi:putative ABC transport system permease protein